MLFLITVRLSLEFSLDFVIAFAKVLPLILLTHVLKMDDMDFGRTSIDEVTTISGDESTETLIDAFQKHRSRIPSRKQVSFLLPNMIVRKSS